MSLNKSNIKEDDLIKKYKILSFNLETQKGLYNHLKTRKYLFLPPIR